MKDKNLPAPVVDPRGAPDFDPALWPTCDGTPLPPGCNDSVLRLKLRLAAAYYAINREHRALLAVRRLSKCSAQSAQERAALQQIERAILAKEAIEAECAPHGLIPEPVIRDGVIGDLRFGKAQKPQAQPSTLSMYIQVGMPHL